MSSAQTTAIPTTGADLSVDRPVVDETVLRSISQRVLWLSAAFVDAGEWSPVIVLEGLTCTGAAAAEHLAYRIWVEAPDEVRLTCGLERDGETHRELWLDSMTTEREFSTEDPTRTRADLRVNGNPDIAHDQESEVVLVDNWPQDRRGPAKNPAR